MRHLCSIGLAFIGGLLLVSCAGSMHPQPISTNNAAATPAPRFVVVSREIKVSHLHFPTGTYRLHSSDNIGYYYRTPRGVVQNAAGGPMLRDGGIFVSKRDPKKIRGYVILAGGVTHVGNLSRMHLRFQN